MNLFDFGTHINVDCYWLGNLGTRLVLFARFKGYLLC